MNISLFIPAKNSFKVSFRSKPLSLAGSQSSHTLTAADEHAKRQWLSTLHKTIDSLQKKREGEEAVGATVVSTPSPVEEMEIVTSGGKKGGKKSKAALPMSPSAVKLLRGTAKGGLFQVNQYKASGVD